VESTFEAVACMALEVRLIYRGAGAPGSVWKRDVSAVIDAREAPDKAVTSKGMGRGLRCQEGRST
jgi:hypothetical protein